MRVRTAILLLALLVPRAGWGQQCPVPDPPTRAPLARTTALSVSDALPAPPTAWQPRFDAIGWPEWWSFHGLPPAFTRVEAGGLNVQSPLSGMARLDLLPVAWLDTLTLDGSRLLAPYRTLDAPRPLTEARYQSSGAIGLQSVEALHAQSRRRTFRGTPWLVHMHVGYTGRAADHEYDNSRLTRGRTTLARVRAERQDGTSLTATLQHARTAMGVSGGVLPPDPADPNSIYDRFQAGVRLGTPLRRTRRTDFALGYASPSRQLHLQYTADALSYERDLRDTVRTFAEVGQWRARGFLPVRIGAFFPVVRGEVQTAPRAAHLELHLHSRAATFTPGVFLKEGGMWPTVHAAWSSRAIYLSAEQSAVSTASFIQNGYGRWLQGLPEAHVQRSRSARGRVVVHRSRDLRLVLHLALSQTVEGYELRLVNPDSSRVERTSGMRGMAGWEARWKDAAPEGFFGSAYLTALRATSEVQGWAETHPALFGGLSAGWRTALFQQDLRLDTRIDVKGWTAHQGYALHGASGMPALPNSSARTAKASGTVDVHVMGHVRTATLFLAAHNVLSNTPLVLGQNLVAGFPLPARTFRFGVYWPILD